MKKTNKLKLVLTTLLLLLGMKIITNQNIQSVQASTVDFGISPVKSNKQVNTSLSYFDLLLKPNEQTDIKVKVSNNSDHVIHVDTYAASATTSDTGSVVYGKSDAKSDSSLSNNMKDIATTTTPTVTLQPKSTQVVNYHVKMPATPIDGMLVGGVNFVERLSDIKQKAKGSMGVKNQYAFSEAIVLHGQTENVKGDLKLKGVDIGQVNYRNVFTSTLRNPNANFINQLNLTQKIYQYGSKKVLYKTSGKMLQIAPNSVFKWGTSLNGDKFKPGKYTLVVDANTKDRTWHFKKDFNIKNNDAKKYNKKDVTIKPDHTWLYVGIGIAILIILLIIWRFISHRNKKHHEEIEAMHMKLEKLESNEKNGDE